MIHYVVPSLFFQFDIGAHMVSNLSFLLYVSPVNEGQSAGDKAQHIDKGKGVATGDEFRQIPHRQPSGVSIRSESPIKHLVHRRLDVRLLYLC